MICEIQIPPIAKISMEVKISKSYVSSLSEQEDVMSVKYEISLGKHTVNVLLLCHRRKKVQAD